MASASSGGGGAGGGPHSSASPSSSAAGAPPSPASLDGGLLLRLLQNPPPPQPRHQTPAAAAAAGPPQQPLFVDPAVAAVGPLFPSASPAGLPHPQHGGGFAWPSPSPSNPQQQQQLRFPDPRFALPLDPYAALGYGGSGAGSRAEKPRSGAPPPGFTTKASSSHPAAASSREASNAFGGMQQRWDPNHQHPRSFGRTLEEQRMARPSVAAHEGLVGAAPGVLPTMRITGGRDMGSGMMNREQHHQRQDHFLSRTPPNGNGPGLIGRMPRGEQLMHSTTGGRMNHGEQHMGTVAGGRLPHRGLRQQDHSLAKMPQGEHRWQGHRDEKGHTSLKLPNENMHGMFSTTSEKEQHQVTMPTSGLVNMDVRENRGKKIVTEANGLEDGVVGGVGFKEIVDGEVVVEARKFEVSDKTNEVRSIGQDEEADDGNKDDDGTIEQLMETVVIDDNGETKSAVVQINGSRSKNFRLDFSRGYIVSSQNVRFHRRNRPCRYDIDQFTPGFMSIFESLVPSDEEISKQKQLLTTLSRLINKEWPTSKLYLYGSCANSFGFSNSDIDLCLSIDDKDMSKVDIILKLADILHAGNLQNIQALTHARVPIVKLMDPITGLSCDICVNNLLAVVNTKLLRDYSQIDKRLRQLAFIVKHWAKSRRVNETYRGTLSSYAYVIMCIHFLQSRRILPCLQEMEPTYYVTVDNNICAYFDQVEKLNGFGAQRKDSLSRLLWAFFKYWAYEHNYTRDVISIRTGRIISKHMKDWTRRVGNDRHLICIEDPFETSHDLGRVVDRNTISDLRGEFERAAEILQYDPNPIVTLFEPFVPSPQGLNQAEENFEQQ